MKEKELTEAAMTFVEHSQAERCHHVPFDQPVAGCGECMARLFDQHTAAMRAELERKTKALEEIVDLKPEEYAFPADWSAQIAGCSECARYKDHPVQRGICNKHRRPLWDRESWDDHEQKALIYRAQRVAKKALSPQEPTQEQEKQTRRWGLAGNAVIIPPTQEPAQEHAGARRLCFCSECERDHPKPEEGR